MSSHKRITDFLLSGGPDENLALRTERLLRKISSQPIVLGCQTGFSSVVFKRTIVQTTLFPVAVTETLFLRYELLSGLYSVQRRLKCFLLYGKCSQYE